MPTIKLKSKDDKIFTVDVEIMKCSTVIRTMVEDLGVDDNDEEIISIPKVNGAIMEKIIQWATYHQNDAPTSEAEAIKIPTDICPWDAEFLKVDESILYELTIAANYLDITGLSNVTYQTIANKVTGKPPEEIRRILNIKNDFTSDEEALIREENDWCEDK